MADGYIQVAPDSTGKKMETSAITLADGTTVHRERVSLGDDDNIQQTQTRLLHEILLELQQLRLRLLDALH
jgi:hypothetical protein